MKIAGSVAGLFGLALLFWIVDAALAQRPPDVRPPDQPPVTRALPAEDRATPPPSA